MMALNKEHFMAPNEWQWRDPDGLIYPWYTKPFLDVLETWSVDKLTIFECGTGHSTKWWAKRAKRVVSVEHDAAWYDLVITDLGVGALSNTEVLLYTEESQYVAAFDRCLDADIIVIDGAWRYKCAEYILSKMKVGAIVILDNVYEFASVRECFRWNIEHFYPQPNHPFWSTSYWIYNNAPYTKTPTVAAKEQISRRMRGIDSVDYQR